MYRKHGHAMPFYVKKRALYIVLQMSVSITADKYMCVNKHQSTSIYIRWRGRQ